MAASDEHGSLTRAFSGLGVDENALISILGKWHPEQRQSFRKGTPDFFIQDERQFERWNDSHVLQLRQEFLRLNEAIVLWTMHPWERDARLLKESLYKGPSQYNVLVEIAATRSAEELLGARRAYHSLFDHSVEEAVAFQVHTPDKKLLVALLSSYRYEGPKVNDEIAKLEAKTISNAIIKGGALVEDEEIVRILSTRSKLHLKAVYKHYKEISGNYLDEDLDGVPRLKETVECLITPQTYFSKVRFNHYVLDASLRLNADEITKDALTRVIPTRADVDMKLIKEEYHKNYGADLPKKIQDVANGNYRDFLLTLIARGD
ncbi:hypothetical protein BUALT_Bualt01G0157700 [Buddleja alternifolia]|uniref:Annexin n=1 Tax=Buddleja alternifolia TaxID=168488 RepID=A0AAV6YHX5_9LAMI|nr:hypothetical protein BUALT_Bualt01G0157700 [Buddleja alternifolia]